MPSTAFVRTTAAGIKNWQQEGIGQMFKFLIGLFIGLLIGALASMLLGYALAIDGGDFFAIFLGALSVAGVITAFLFEFRTKRVIRYALAATLGVAIFFLSVGLGYQYGQQERRFLESRLIDTKENLKEVRNALSKEIDIPVASGAPWHIYQFVLGQGAICRVRFLGINGTGILHSYRDRFVKVLLDGGSIQIMLWRKDLIQRRAREEEAFGAGRRSYRVEEEWKASIAILNDILYRVMHDYKDLYKFDLDVEQLEERFEIRFLPEQTDRSLLFADHIVEPERPFELHVLRSLGLDDWLRWLERARENNERCSVLRRISQNRQEIFNRYLVYNRYPVLPKDPEAPTPPGLAGPTNLVEGGWPDYQENHQVFRERWEEATPYPLDRLSELYRGAPTAGESPAAQLFMGLTKSTNWKLVETIKLKFNTYHPQGMVKIGDHFYLSSVEIVERPRKFDQPVEGYDRTPGKGVGHLFKFGIDGELISSVTLGEGIAYHPGGIDYDGQWIWVPVAEYRPDSSSIIYRVDPDTMRATEVFRFNDHIGGIVHNIEDKTLRGVSWESRRFYTWHLNERLNLRDPSAPSDRLRRLNGSHYIDYQDCHYVRRSHMLCGGVSWYETPMGRVPFGGLELLDLESQLAVHQVPVPLWVNSNTVMTYNPYYFEVHEGNIRFYFAPEDNETTVFVYDSLNQ